VGKGGFWTEDFRTLFRKGIKGWLIYFFPGFGVPGGFGGQELSYCGVQHRERYERRRVLRGGKNIFASSF